MALKKGKEKKPVTMFYYCMFQEPCSAKDIARMSGLAEDRIEVWTESDICELTLDVDALVFENASEDFTAEEDRTFLRQKGIRSVYAVTFADVDEAKAMAILKKTALVKKGIVCSDTEDFTPIVIGSF